MIILLTINAWLALLTCIPIPFILFSGWVFAAKVRPNFRKSQKALAQLNAKLQDNLSGIHEIQAFGQEEYETGQVHGQASAYTGAMLHALNISAFFHPAVEFLSSIGTVIVVGVGGVLACLLYTSLCASMCYPLIISFKHFEISNRDLPLF